MRVAILISGQPRFSREFDVFLEKLIGYDQVDWFFYLWKSNSPTTFTLNSHGHNLIPPMWQNIDEEQAIKKLKKNLPKNHYVAGFGLSEEEVVIIPKIDESSDTPYNNNIWKMWYGWYRVNQMKKDYEKSGEFEYDLVIKARPDVALYDIVDTRIIKKHLSNTTNVVIMPINHTCGHEMSVCDLFGMTSSKNMDIYADLYNQALDHYYRGTIFQAETMLGKHLIFHGLEYRHANFKIEFRIFGDWENKHTGISYTSKNVPTWEDHIYISDFGQWE
jgi:hypothetical protein